MDVSVRTRVVAGKVATGPSSSASFAFIIGGPFAFALPRLLLSFVAGVMIVTTVGSRVISRVGINPPIIILMRVSIDSLLSFVFAFAFNVAFILVFTIRGIGLATFTMFAIFLLTLFLSAIGLNVSLNAAIMA